VRHVNEASAAAAVAPIRERLAQLGRCAHHRDSIQRHKAAAGTSSARSTGECINPGNVGRGSKRDRNSLEMIELPASTPPVRIGVNWGSLDQTCSRA
jgi:(E)-4-hydroxy-3-methylbut-2-enyl-diphosphate synthase